MIAALLGAACSGGDADDAAPTPAADDSSAEANGTAASETEPATPRMRSFLSADGNAMVLAPIAEETPITVTVLDPADYPPFLAGAVAGPGTIVYDLGPTGATFDTPVRFFRRIETANIDVDLEPLEVPIILTVTADAEGNPELAADQTILRTHDAVWIGASFDHFSPAVSINTQATADTNEVFRQLLAGIQDAEGAPVIDVVAAPIDLGVPPPSSGIDLSGLPGGPPVLFADGFESGDVSAWSATTTVTGLRIPPGWGRPPRTTYDEPRPIDITSTGSGSLSLSLTGHDSAPVGLNLDGIDLPATPFPATVLSLDGVAQYRNPPLFDFDLEVPIDIGLLGVADDEAAQAAFRAAIDDVLDIQAKSSESERPSGVGSAVITTSIGHAPVRANPSAASTTFQQQALDELLALFPEGVYTFTAEPDAGPGGWMLVDAEAPVPQGDGTATATTGVTCYCDFHLGVVSARLPVEELVGLRIEASPDGDRLVRDGVQLDIPISILRTSPGGPPVVIGVGPDEGTVFEGEVHWDLGDIERPPG